MLAVAVYILSLYAFIFDAQRDTTLAFGIIYSPMVATGLLYRDRRVVWFLAAIACIAVVLGAMLPFGLSDDDEVNDLIGNRLLSFVAIGSTVAFVNISRRWQERLQAETRRAEDAERVKADLLKQLSKEIQTPMHALLGILTLTMSSGRPDRETLGRIVKDSRQLLATIDDLVHLAQMDERVLQADNVDIANAAREAARVSAGAARERQISIAIDDGERPLTAVADGWALRRILENLLANAIRLAPAGSTVKLSLREAGGQVTASVTDAGGGFRLPVAMDHDENAPATDGERLRQSGATGLALSSRLASAMNGRLTATTQPGAGVVVSLSLPAA
jgi:signal transduction histidine kinase